jgi:hypothetical protein
MSQVNPPAMLASATSKSIRFIHLAAMSLIPGLEYTYEIEIADPAADNERRNRNSGHNDKRAVRVGRAQHDERQPIEIALEAFDEYKGKTISCGPADGNCGKGEYRELQKQQARDLVFSKAKHTQLAFLHAQEMMRAV